jgi:small subunit ribosomal protein S15
MLTKQEKTEVVQRYSPEGKNTGSSAVQIAILSRRIGQVSEHLKGHLEDHASRRGLLRMVGKRRSLLRYLQRSDRAVYEKIAAEFNLR